MRTCLGIVCGLIFLLASSLFLLVLNLNKTVYNAKFDKEAINDSGIYQSVPEVLTEMVSNGQISVSSDQKLSAESQAIIIETINSVLTPEVLKKHSESIINQALSDQIIVTEDLSDINNQVNERLGSTFSKQMGIAVSANPENTFVPDSVSFDKSQNQFGQTIIYRAKALWITFVVALIFMVLLFFASANNYKSRFKWLSGFLVVLTVLALANFIVLRLIGFDWLVNAVQSSLEGNLVQNVSTQLTQILSALKNRFSLLYLYEFVVLVVLTSICFIASSLISAKQMVQEPASQIKPKEEVNNAPKKS